MRFFLLLLFVFLIFYIVSIYNKIVYFRNLAKQAESDIDVFLKKRADLLGKLIEVVKGYSDFERKTLERIAKARAVALDLGVKDLDKDKEVRKGIKTLFALAENYPVLKANENYLELQRDITKIEEDLQKARRYYNGVVQAFNTFIEKFPNIIIVKLFNVKKLEYLEFEEVQS